MASEQEAAMELALGRILRLASRSAQPGDIAEYERCRKIIVDMAEELGIDSTVQRIGTHRPGWNFGGACVE